MNELKEENKYLFCDLNSVQDPEVRAYFQEEQIRILQKDVVINMNKKLLLHLPHLNNTLTILVDLEAIYLNIKSQLSMNLILCCLFLILAFVFFG